MDLQPDKAGLGAFKARTIGGGKDVPSFLRWALGRDAYMLATLAPHLRAAEAGKRLGFVFVGAAHGQRSGSLLVPKVGGPDAAEARPLEVRFLGRRLAEEGVDLVAVDGNDPGDPGDGPGCRDGVETALVATRAGRAALEPVTIDLRTSPLGATERNRDACLEGPFVRLKAKYVPEGYRARDHFDFFVFHPAR
jgi:hypothetical protein